VTQLEAIVSLVTTVLGDDVVGAYLHGSAVLGQLHPRSDTDILVVSRRGLAPAERRALTDGIMAISGRRAHAGPARPIELTVVVQSEVRPWRYPPRSEFLYGEWLRDGYERGEVPEAAESPDLAPLISMVLLGNRAVFGPPPSTVLDPVPGDDLVRAVVHGIPGLLDDLEPDTANVLLTLARIWTTVATGEIRAKDAAADWALGRLPEEHRPVLARARAVYLGEVEDERWDDIRPSLRPHADFVIREIERAVAATAPADP
jgi:streptomycin 3"-adenylyltransferase